MRKQCVPGPFSSSSSKGLETRLGVQWNMSLNMSALRSACKNYLGTCHTMYMPVRIRAYLPDHTNTSRHNMMINLQLKDSDLAKDLANTRESGVLNGETQVG